VDLRDGHRLQRIEDPLRTLIAFDAQLYQIFHGTGRGVDIIPTKGSTAMELAANQSKTMSKSGTIQAFIKDIFCLVREATAPCDILLKVRRISTYLLTYLLGPQGPNFNLSASCSYDLTQLANVERF